MLRELDIIHMMNLCLPINSLGYSQKGWMDKVIGIEYGKQFEKQTRNLAKGRYRSLYVNGHNSHVTCKFLTHCQNSKIHVQCYPAHMTHVLQGLDVVVFGPLKVEYGKCRDKLLRDTGEAISKENFLRVYGKAHLKVLKPDLIKMAFEKTGIVPFSRDVIISEMLAPSKDTSFRHFSPIEPPEAVHIMTDLMVDVLQPIINQSEANEQTNNSPAALTTHRNLFPIPTALPKLLSSETGFLISKSPIKASSSPPDISTIEIFPVKQRITNKQSKAEPVVNVNLLTVEVKTALEKALQNALKAKDSEAQYYKSHAAKLQSMMVLQRLYCQRVRRQLNTKEVKDSKKGKKGGRILGDGLPKLLTSDEFIALVDKHEVAMEKAERAKQARKALRAQYEVELAEWELNEEGRKERNVALLQEFETMLTNWENARKAAKGARAKLKDWDQQNPKPKKKDFVEKAVVKPKLKKVDIMEGDEEVGVGGDWTDEGEDENDS